MSASQVKNNNKINPSIYFEIFKTKQAYSFDIAGFLMRLFLNMCNIGILTMLTLSGYSFLLAGIISSIVAGSIFILSPKISKLIDKYGQSKIIPIFTIISMLGMISMICAVIFAAPFWLFILCGIFIGFVPLPQPLVRARWSHLINAKKTSLSLNTAFSYEGIIDDVSFMIGPALSIFLATSISPCAGMIFGTICYIIGSICLCLSKNSEPASCLKSSTTSNLIENNQNSINKKSIFAYSPLLFYIFVSMMIIGTIYGILDTATVGFAEDMGNPNFASLVLMSQSIVSIISAFIFGMIHLTFPINKQLSIFTIVVGIFYGSTLLITNDISLFWIITLSALSYAPFIITANLVCEKTTSPDKKTEALTWITAGMSIGSALGPFVGGIIVDEISSLAAFGLCGGLALILVGIGIYHLCLHKTTTFSKFFKKS